MSLSGKVVLVTGAARGIGRAIALQVANAGADVAVADLRNDGLSESVSLIEATGRKALAVTVDVTKPAQVNEMVTRVVGHFGGIDVFFNNAGVIKVQDFFEITESDWNETMDVNAKGVFLCGQAVARHMVDRGHGKIINTASIAGRQGVADSLVYAASKAAVISITRSMSLALARRGVTVNALAPGMVDTDMWALIDKQTAEMRGMAVGEPKTRRARRIPRGRPATPEDIAAVAEFLASAGSDHMSGQTLNIDGGEVHG